MTVRFSNNTKQLLEKSRESATQAVSTYNDPRSIFRTGNFTVLMIIAWTSLLHAYFEHRKINYFYKKGRFYIRINGDKKAWELSECIKHVFEENNPIRKNLELFIAIRNKIEHRNLPAIDSELMGECQALVINFEEWIRSQFGEKQSLVDTLFIPLQLTSRQNLNLQVSKTERRVLEKIYAYRSLLDTSVDHSQQYSFKAYLVPKIGNHRNSSDVAIEFIKYDSENPQEMEKYEKAIVAIKEKQIPVSNEDKLLPSAVLGELKKLGYEVTMNWHTNMWKKYEVRPSSKSSRKYNCNTEFCVYDNAHGDYLYTRKWVNFLLKNELDS
jgi:hypothetical protein